MWRDGEGKHIQRRNRRFRCTFIAPGGGQPMLWSRGSRAGSGPRRSGVRDDRRALKWGHDAMWRPLALASALEQHPPLKRARTHEREALEHPLSNLVIIGRHQSNRLEQPGKQYRFAQRLLQKNFPVEGPVLGANAGKAAIGIEMAACDIAEPHGHVRQFRENPRLVRIGYKARWVDDDFAPVEKRMQYIAEHVRGRRAPPLCAKNADANRTVEFTAIIDAEREVVRLIVVAIGDAPGFRGQNRSLRQIGAVAQAIDLVLLLRRLGEPIIYMFERVRAAFRKQGG